MHRADSIQYVTLESEAKGLKLYHIIGDIYQMPFSRAMLIHNENTVDLTISLAKQGFVSNTSVYIVGKGYGGGKDTVLSGIQIQGIVIMYS